MILRKDWKGTRGHSEHGSVFICTTNSTHFNSVPETNPFSFKGFFLYRVYKEYKVTFSTPWWLLYKVLCGSSQNIFTYSKELDWLIKFHFYSVFLKVDPLKYQMIHPQNKPLKQIGSIISLNFTEIWNQRFPRSHDPVAFETSGQWVGLYMLW